MKKIKQIFAVCIIIFTVLSCNKNVGNPSGNDNDDNTNPQPRAPVANFSVSAASGDAPFNINFSDNSMGDVISWSWDFGDGTASSEKNPSHTYTKLGSYTVSLTVTNTGGSNSKVYTNAITVYEIKTYSYPSLGAFYPTRTFGDYEFDGHGPTVNVTANLVTTTSSGNQSLKLKLTMSAKETVSDWSTAYGEWYALIANIPTNATIKNILTSSSSSRGYTDNDHGYYILSAGELGEFWTMGDTDGDDICSGGCNTGDTHLYFKKFYCQIRIQPK